MNGWIYIAIVIGLLLAFGAAVDWRRRGSTGGIRDGADPSEARRRTQAQGSMYFNEGGGGGSVG